MMHCNKTYSSDHIYCMDVFRFDSGEAKKLAIIVPVLVLSHY